jgi:hypothetical protein
MLRRNVVFTICIIISVFLSVFSFLGTEIDVELKDIVTSLNRKNINYIGGVSSKYSKNQNDIKNENNSFINISNTASKNSYNDLYQLESQPKFLLQYTIDLYQGYNLITVPTENNFTAEPFSQNITNSTVIIKLKPNIQTFIAHIKGIPHDDFLIEDGIGYFVHVINDSIFSGQGSVISSVNVHLYEGWNLIGWFNQTSTNAENLGENITGCTVVIMFNASTQTFKTHVVGTPHDNFIITSGMGILIWTTNESWWQGYG